MRRWLPRRTARCVAVIAWVACGAAATLFADGKHLPSLLWDVNFNTTPDGRIPEGLGESENNPAEEIAGRFPQRTYNWVSWLTRKRRLAVQASFGDLRDRPLVLTFDEDDPIGPQYGPQMSFHLPHAVAAAGGRFRLSLDACKGNTAQAGAFSLGDVGAVRFREEGIIEFNGNDIGHYESRAALHFDLLIDTQSKTVTCTARGVDTRTLTVPWQRPTGSFSGLRLDGYLPGGYARGRGQIAFDNIKLVREETP